MDNSSDHRHRHHHPCDDFTTKVLRCHKKYGKQGEECVREELEQKKCFAQLFCRNEARKFYDEKSVPRRMSMTDTGVAGMTWNTFLYSVSSNGNGDGNETTDKEALVGDPHPHQGQGGRVSCATLVEVFAKPENELLIPEGMIDKDDRIFCRKIVHELALCLSSKRRGATS